MRTFKILITALAAAVLFSACANDGDSSLLSKVKLENKPQVIDVLKGKSKAEILKMKYKELKTTCNLVTVKTTRDQITAFFADAKPAQYQAAEEPVNNPSESSLTYDLKLQQLIDNELTKEIKSKIVSSLDGKILKVDLTFKPVVFQESLNLIFNKTKYVMKHTPILSYSAIYELIQDGTSTFATTEAKVYEKIEGQKNAFVVVQVGADKYSFVLDCKLDRSINTDNKDLAAEFESQWGVINL